MRKIRARLFILVALMSPSCGSPSGVERQSPQIARSAGIAYKADMTSDTANVIVRLHATNENMTEAKLDPWPTFCFVHLELFDTNWHKALDSRRVENCPSVAEEIRLRPGESRTFERRIQRRLMPRLSGLFFAEVTVSFINQVITAGKIELR